MEVAGLLLRPSLVYAVGRHIRIWSWSGPSATWTTGLGSCWVGTMTHDPRPLTLSPIPL